MSHEEALEWLCGNRSSCNNICGDPQETWQERIARCDAALTEQAYWTARAWKEGLLP